MNRIECSLAAAVVAALACGCQLRAQADAPVDPERAVRVDSTLAPTCELTPHDAFAFDRARTEAAAARTDADTCPGEPELDEAVAHYEAGCDDCRRDAIAKYLLGDAQPQTAALAAQR